jgi:hypothetical protein
MAYHAAIKSERVLRESRRSEKKYIIMFLYIFKTFYYFFVKIKLCTFYKYLLPLLIIASYDYYDFQHKIVFEFAKYMFL